MRDRGALALALAVSAGFLAHPGGAASQAVEPRIPVERAEFGGRAHLQFNTTSAPGDTPASEFFVRRARIWAAVRVNDWLDGSVLVDMAGATASARYAFMRMTFDPALRVSVGQFKRAFDMFELTSSSDMLLVERDGVIRGAPSPCAGVGGQCTYSRFSERLGLSSLDVGILAQGDLADGRISYLASLTNGTGPNTRETNDAKSFSGRLAMSLSDGVAFGLNLAAHDYTHPATSRDEYAGAWSADVEVGDFSRGFHAQAAVLGGENWRAPDTADGPPSFVAAQTVLSYRVATSPTGRVRGFEPLTRLSWGDPDSGVERDGGVLFTPGMAVHFEGKNKLIGNLDIWQPDEGPRVWSFKASAMIIF